MKKNGLKALMGKELQLDDSVWGKLTAAWIAFLIFMGAANLIVAYTFSEQQWVNYKLFGTLGHEDVVAGPHSGGLGRRGNWQGRAVGVKTQAAGIVAAYTQVLAPAFAQLHCGAGRVRGLDADAAHAALRPLRLGLRHQVVQGGGADGWLIQALLRTGAARRPGGRRQGRCTACCGSWG